MPDAGQPPGSPAAGHGPAGEPEPGEPASGKQAPGWPVSARRPSGDSGPGEPAADQVSAARLYDFLLGGRRNFAVDRELGRRLLDAEPGILQAARSSRAFLGRAVRFLATAGIGQFLDLGSGMPAADSVHEVARQIRPGARVGYVDSDPSAVAHSRRALAGDPGTTAVLHDLRDPGGVLADPEVREVLDLDKPVGLLLVTVLHQIPDADDPAEVVRSYARRIAPGSYLVLAHPTFESCPAAGAIAELCEGSVARIQARSRAAIAGFLDGLDLAEPGIVHLPLWRPDGPMPERPERAWSYGGVGRKPGTAPDGRPGVGGRG
jgi:SAM-dependent methyltransferase